MSDGVSVARVRAAGDRPDVANVFPGHGPAHGFDVTVLLSSGTHDVCVTIVAPSQSPLRCAQVFVVREGGLTLPPGSPIGSLDAVTRVPGGLRADGWALDPDTASAIDVHVYANTVGVAGNAAGHRPDIGAAFTGYGANHGYSIAACIVPAASVCAPSASTSTRVATSRSVAVRSTSRPETLSVLSTWSPACRVGSGSAAGPSILTTRHRHRSTSMSMVEESRRLRVRPMWALSSRPWAHCTVMTSPSPRGRVDGASASLRSIWDLAPIGGSRVVTSSCPEETPSERWTWRLVAKGTCVLAVGLSTQTRRSRSTFTCMSVQSDSQYAPAGPRPDVAAAAPGYGSNHGFDATLPAGGGTQQVCVFGINVGIGGNVPLACRTVQVT